MNQIQNQNREFNQDTFGAVLNHQPEFDTPTFNPLVCQPFLSRSQAYQARNERQVNWGEELGIYEASRQKQGQKINNNQSNLLKKRGEGPKKQLKNPISDQTSSPKQKKGLKSESGRKKAIRKSKKEQPNKNQPKILDYFKASKKSVDK